MKNTTLFFLLLFVSSSLFSQGWNIAGDVPPATRYDDICFVTPTLGWTCNGNGGIYKTTDGGYTWLNVFQDTFYFRTIDFVDQNIGFAGTLDSALLRTFDGGDTWERIEDSIPVPIKGVCGLDHIGSNIYGVGIWSYPGYFIKSTDLGNTWTYTDMSAYATGLVDCHFMDENVGFVSGISNQGAVILKTIDGGDSWTLVFTSQTSLEYIWKMHFVNNNLAYGSVESFGNETAIVKTEDGGDTWTEIQVAGIGLDIQAIGFMDELHGWIGSRYDGLFETNDGGFTWSPVGGFPNVNRIIKINDELLFGSGSIIYKYDNTVTAEETPVPAYYAHEILGITPNPFSHEVNIGIRIDHKTFTKLDLLTMEGKHVTSIFDGRLEPGIHNFKLTDKVTTLQNGVYILLLRTNEGFQTKEVVKVNNG